jgi:catechol 2,3-dioxygenase-like lactoylglutathione lyase family enzyme
MQIRVARPTRDLEAARRFYGEALGLPVVASFDDHDGYSGVVFGLPDASRQLELVAREGEEPRPTEEDQLVMYLGSVEKLRARASRLRAAGLEPRMPSNPYWQRNGAVGFVDPDGYWLILSPEDWVEAR